MIVVARGVASGRLEVIRSNSTGQVVGDDCRVLRGGDVAADPLSAVSTGCEAKTGSADAADPDLQAASAIMSIETDNRAISFFMVLLPPAASDSMVRVRALAPIVCVERLVNMAQACVPYWASGKSSAWSRPARSSLSVRCSRL